MTEFIYQIYKNFTAPERRIFWVALAIFLVSGILWGMLLFYANTAEKPIESSLYQEGIIGQPVAINPVIAANDADRDLVKLLFSDLIDLAENYQTSKDGQSWKITLKQNLRWSDGKPLTSDDIIFTIDVIQNSESRSPLFPTWQGVVIDRLSELGVEFTLRNPYAFFLDNLKELKIVPKHIFGLIPPENFRLSGFNLEPVGSGPYKFVSFEKRKDGFISAYHLTRNDYYPLKKPFIKNFDLKFYQNSADLISAFNQRKIDGFGGINPKNTEELKLGHKILEKFIPRYYAVFVNKNAASSLNDKSVMAALNLTADKSKIVNEIFSGKALIVNQPILPPIEGYSSSTDPGNEFSPEKAMELLNKSGWAINKETGVRTKKVGRQTESLDYSVIVPQIPFLTDTVNSLKESWAKIGVNLNPVILHPADITNEVIKTRNYQMIIFGNILKNNPDIFSFWHSSERFYPGLNLALYNSKKADELLESIRKNLNADSRKADLAKLQKIISDDQPAIFLYSPSYLYVSTKNLEGFEENILNTPADRFENVNQWYLDTKRVF